MSFLGALAIGGALLGGSLWADHKNREAQKGINEQNQVNDRSKFDYIARYNSPVNQMARLRDAGLNPALVYEGGNPTGQQAPTTAIKSEAGHYNNPVEPAVKGLQAYMDMAQQSAVTDNVSAMQGRNVAQTKLLNQETAESAARTGNQLIQNNKSLLELSKMEKDGVKMGSGPLAETFEKGKDAIQNVGKTVDQLTAPQASETAHQATVITPSKTGMFMGSDGRYHKSPSKVNPRIRSPRRSPRLLGNRHK